MASRGNTLPFSLKAPILPERDLHVAVRDLLDYCLAPPAVWAPMPVGVTRLTAEQFAQYSRFGVKRGWPDCLICHGKMWGLELKTKRGRLSKTRVGRTARGGPRELIGQEDMFPKLLASGAWGAIEIARSIDDVCELLDRWRIPRIGGKSWRAVVQPTLSGPPLGGTSGKLAAGGNRAQ